MNHELIGLAIDTGGAFLMMALAIWVWRVRPSARLNRVFAAVVTAIAISILFLNLRWASFYLGDPNVWVPPLLELLTAVVLVAVAGLLLVLSRMFWPKGRLSRVGVLVAAISLLVHIFAWGSRFLASFAQSSPPAPAEIALALSQEVAQMAIMVLLVGLAMGYRATGRGAPHRRWQIATVAIAMGVFPMYVQGAITVAPPSVLPTLSTDLFFLVAILVVAGAWVWAAMGENGRLAWFTAWVILGVSLAGVAAGVWFGFDTAINSGAIGVLRVAATGLLAYAIVRHQLFDIDLKIKWGISRGTLAAIFIATFFVVSELVSGLLSQTIGIVSGVLITGVLVFALSPLQRIADRLADSAMPHVRDTEAYRRKRAGEIYRAAVGSALEDGVVTEKERDVLATLAQELGLGPKDCREIERSLAPSSKASG